IVFQYWGKIRTPVLRFRPGSSVLWTAKGGLEILLAINVGTYALLTFASVYQKVINLPMDIDRENPQVRQLLMSMMIVLKAIAMALSVYLIWATVNIGMGHGQRLPGWYLAVFVVAVAMPLILYTGKLRRYSK